MDICIVLYIYRLTAPIVCVDIPYTIEYINHLSLLTNISFLLFAIPIVFPFLFVTCIYKSYCRYSPADVAKMVGELISELDLVCDKLMTLELAQVCNRLYRLTVDMCVTIEWRITKPRPYSIIHLFLNSISHKHHHTNIYSIS